MNTNKRKYRELDPEIKQKISQAMKGKSKSFTHKEAISNGLKSYWKNIPNGLKSYWKNIPHKPTAN